MSDDRYVIDQIRDATDLVSLIGEHVQLTKKGREWTGLCPFHNDSRPSMSVVTHKGTPFYKCHSCGAGGDAISFLRGLMGMEFREALEMLANRAGIELPKQSGFSSGPSKRTLREACSIAQTFFIKHLNTTGKNAEKYMTNRKFSNDTLEKFSIGYAPDGWQHLREHLKSKSLTESICLEAGLLRKKDSTGRLYDSFRNRIIFPINDDAGNPIAFGARAIRDDDEPKYLNSAETPVFSKSKTLYGYSQALPALREKQTAIVMEGYTDVLAAHQAGFKNTVGTLGTALTSQHAQILNRVCNKVTLVFDGDMAGQRAADRAVAIFFGSRLDVQVCVLPTGMDPADILLEENGNEKFTQLLNNSTDALNFKLSLLRESLNKCDGLSSKQNLVESFLNELSRLGFYSTEIIRRSMVLAQISDITGVSEYDLKKVLGKNQPNQTPTKQLQKEAIETPIIKEITPARKRAERELLAALLFHYLDGRKEKNTIKILESIRFSIPNYQPIAEAIASDNGRDLVSILTVLPEAEGRIASALWFEGKQLTDSREDNSSTALVEACKHAYDRLLQREQELLTPFSEGDFATKVNALRKERQENPCPTAMVKNH